MSSRIFVLTLSLLVGSTALAAPIATNSSPIAFKAGPTVEVTLVERSAKAFIAHLEGMSSMPLGGTLLRVDFESGLAVVRVTMDARYAGQYDMDSFDLGQRMISLFQTRFGVGRVEASMGPESVRGLAGNVGTIGR